MLEYITINIEFVIEKLKDTGYINPVPPEATYMIWLDCRQMGMSPEELNRFFIDEAATGLSEGSMFGPGGEGFMRMNIACPFETVKKAINNIRNALLKLDK